MRSPLVFASPPLASTTSVRDYLLARLPRGMSLTETDVAPLTTESGWSGALHRLVATDGGPDVARPPTEILAARFAVGVEYSVVATMLDPGSPDAVADRATRLEALRSTAPWFPGDLTLADLLAVPEHLTAADSATPHDASPAPIFDGLRRSWTPTGVVFDRPDAPDAGRVELRFAVFPPVALREASTRALEAMSEAEGQAHLAEAETGTTADGEHFAVVAVTGRSSERRLAMVHAERHMVVLDARYGLGEHAPRFREVVSRLVRQLPLRGVPTLRTRSVLHAVPAGWVVRTRDMTTHLFAPDGRTPITVLPAAPVGEPERDLSKLLYEDVLTQFTPSEAPTLTPHRTPHGLEGRIVQVRGTSTDVGAGPFTLQVARLTDGRFRYIVRYEDVEPVREAAFREVVDSLRPVPIPVADEPESGLLRQLFPTD